MTHVDFSRCSVQLSTSLSHRGTQMWVPGCYRTKFCTVGGPNICGSHSTELVSCHPYGAYNFEMALRILENLCTPALTDELSKCVYNFPHFSATVLLLHLKILCTLFLPHLLLTNKILDTVQALRLKKHTFWGLDLPPSSGGMRKGENPL
jgi:hypothetical protein